MNTVEHGSQTITTKMITLIPARSSQPSMTSGAWGASHLVNTIVASFVMTIRVNTHHRFTQKIIRSFSHLGGGRFVFHRKITWRFSWFPSRFPFSFSIPFLSWVIRVSLMYSVSWTVTLFPILLGFHDVGVDRAFRRHRTFPF